MDLKPNIHPQAIDLMTRIFNSHKVGLPEWLKNAREAYLKVGAGPEERHIVVNLQNDCHHPYLECIDFAGIAGDAIAANYLQWANPDGATSGLPASEVSDVEAGQGNGGKGYLREMFNKGYFISICNKRLSVVGFVDSKKHVLYFVPSEPEGKDNPDDNPLLPKLRAEAKAWLHKYGLPQDHNITIVRGIDPKKPVDPQRLAQVMQQFPQARQTIRTCKVDFCVNGAVVEQLALSEPDLHKDFPTPVRIPVPLLIEHHGARVPTTKPPEYGPGELELKVSARPLQGQALSTWNRIDFHGTSISTIGWKPIEELPLQYPQYSRHLFGSLKLPLLVDPEDKYEMQGRRFLKDGDLSGALYDFVAQEADRILAKLQKQVATSVSATTRKNLEALNTKLAAWVESKLSTPPGGLDETGLEVGVGKPPRRPPGKRKHEPPAVLKIHRENLDICVGVNYPLRAVAYDAKGIPVPPGRTVWRSQHPAVASVHPEKGIVEARSAGLTTITATNDTGLTSSPLIVQTHEAARIEIRTAGPARLDSRRRLALAVTVKTSSHKAIKDAIVSWRSHDERVATVGPDGFLVGGEVGETEVVAFAGDVRSEALEVVIEKGAGGKPLGGGKGKPRILLSGVNSCPFEPSNPTPVNLDPSDPPVHQRAYKPDQQNNVFWINLQHPLAEALLKQGEGSVQWRTYHFQRTVDVFTMLELRSRYADNQQLSVEEVLDEIRLQEGELYRKAKEEVFELLYDEKVDLSTIWGN
jgi:hypothetical protein